MWTNRASEFFLGESRPAVLALLGALALSGCASTPTTYDLHPSAASARVFRGALSVEAPLAAPPLDGDLIVVRGPDDRLASLDGAQWVERPSFLIRSRLIQTFENAGLLRNLRRAGEPADYRLTLEIRRFDIDAPSRQARVEIAAQLTTAGGKAVAAKIFAAAEPVAEIAGAEPPLALDRALGRVMPQIVAWTANR